MGSPEGTKYNSFERSSKKKKRQTAKSVIYKETRRKKERKGRTRDGETCNAINRG